MRTFRCTDVSMYGHFSVRGHYFFLIGATHPILIRNRHVLFAHKGKQVRFCFLSLFHFPFDPKPCLWFHVWEVLTLILLLFCLFSFLVSSYFCLIDRKTQRGQLFLENSTEADPPSDAKSCQWATDSHRNTVWLVRNAVKERWKVTEARIRKGIGSGNLMVHSHLRFTLEQFAGAELLKNIVSTEILWHPKPESEPGAN